MKDIHILAFTHRQLEVSQIGHLHIEPDNQKDRLQCLKEKLALSELLFLSTCNRVEFIFCTNKEIDEEFIAQFIKALYPHFDEKLTKLFSSSYEYYFEINAVKHLLKVASSIDSMIVGEREIITQVRKAFDDCKAFGLTGDSIRLLIRFTIETAKRIYTETNIAQRPVSVVSLAYHTLKSKHIPLDARILVIGAGVTNANMLRFLKKHGFKNFTLFNRTLEKAVDLAKQVKGRAFALSTLHEYTEGFDVIITCTGAEEPVITLDLYRHLLQGEKTPKTVIDLAIPHDLEERIPKNFAVDHISVDYLQAVSRKNLKERTKEIIYVDKIIAEAVLTFRNMCKEREVEQAMRLVPEEIKTIKKNALDHVFAKDLDGLDKEARETLEKILCHFEKKYISVPMKMAKEILLNK